MKKLRRSLLNQPIVASLFFSALALAGFSSAPAPSAPAFVETAFGSVLLLVFFYLSLACRLVLVLAFTLLSYACFICEAQA